MAGIFQYKKLPQLQLLPLAAAYVGYIVLCNLSLNINTVGFYQVMKASELSQLILCCASTAQRCSMDILCTVLYDFAAGAEGGILSPIHIV
jgi:hypothetical protein